MDASAAVLRYNKYNEHGYKRACHGDAWCGMRLQDTWPGRTADATFKNVYRFITKRQPRQVIYWSNKAVKLRIYHICTSEP